MKFTPRHSILGRMTDSLESTVEYLSIAVLTLCVAVALILAYILLVNPIHSPPNHYSPLHDSDQPPVRSHSKPSPQTIELELAN